MHVFSLQQEGNATAGKQGIYRQGGSWGCSRTARVLLSLVESTLIRWQERNQLRSEGTPDWSGQEANRELHSPPKTMLSSR